MIMDGAKPASAHQVHRTVRTALGEAQRRGHVTKNVAALAKPARVEVEEVQPYTVEEVRAILAAAEKEPNRARSSRQPVYVMPGYTMPDTRLPRCCWSSAFLSAPSWESWAGRVPPWPRAISTSQTRFVVRSRRRSAACSGRWRRGLRMAIETKTETHGASDRDGRGALTGVGPGQVSGGCGIRTREGLHPTRFPSERHRPLGESSARNLTGNMQPRRTHVSPG